jgi:transcriptional regulator with XRE-family HTH domain
MEDDADAFEAALAVVIHEHRAQRGWSLERLASAAGLHRTSIGLVERGSRGLSAAAAYRIAAALGVPLSALIAEAENRLAK